MVREFSERVQNDTEASTASSIADDFRSRTSWSKRKVISFFGGTALLCMVAMLTHRLRSDRLFSPQETVRSLLTSDEFADISASTMADTTNLIEKAEIRSVVVNNMGALVNELERENQQTFGKAMSASLSSEQQEALLAAVSSMKDARVQTLGRQVASIVQKHSNEGPYGVQRQLAVAFQNHDNELMQIRETFFPGMRKLDKDNCRLFDGLGRKKELEIRRLANKQMDGWPINWGTLNSTSDEVPTEQKLRRALSIVAGLLEQTRVAMSQATFLGDAFGTQTAIPSWATGLVAGAAFLAQLASCVLQSDENNVLAMMCPMKYASAAADFLASFESILTITDGGSSTEKPA